MHQYSVYSRLVHDIMLDTANPYQTHNSFSLTRSSHWSVGLIARRGKPDVEFHEQRIKNGFGEIGWGKF
jgi:hypothetical protein